MRPFLRYTLLLMVALALAPGGRAQAGGFVFSPINAPGATDTSAYRINDMGQIVGTFTDGSGTHGFLDVSGSFSTLDVPGAATTSAQGLNTFGGQIVGFYTDSNGAQHGFVATSVPEPSTLVLSGISAVFVVVLGLRQRVQRGRN